MQSRFSQNLEQDLERIFVKNLTRSCNNLVSRTWQGSCRDSWRKSKAEILMKILAGIVEKFLAENLVRNIKKSGWKSFWGFHQEGILYKFHVENLVRILFQEVKILYSLSSGILLEQCIGQWSVKKSGVFLAPNVCYPVIF